MLLEAVEDDGLRAIKEPADSGEETRGERQCQTTHSSAVTGKTCYPSPVSWDDSARVFGAPFSMAPWAVAIPPCSTNLLDQLRFASWRKYMMN